MKKPYEAPKVYELGRVEELTQDGDLCKLGGSGDQFFPRTIEDSVEDGCEDPV